MHSCDFPLNVDGFSVSTNHHPFDEVLAVIRQFEEGFNR